MRTNFVLILLLLVFAGSSYAQEAGQETPKPVGGDFSVNPLPKKLPTDVILVKGAVASASDTTTLLPEGGNVTDKVYTNRYFDMSYNLPADWFQKYLGPPPSDSGFYVLTQIEPRKTIGGTSLGTILISAQDMFFTLTPAHNSLEMITFQRDRLGPDFKVERQPTVVKIANRPFIRMDYTSPIAELHWYTLITQIRCHAVQFTFTGRDPQMLESLVQGLDKMQLPADTDPALGIGGGSEPVCVKDYANGGNVTHKIDPVLPGRKFNPIPVRITIDKNGKVKHIHIISAFPDQAKIITDALMQWEFKPYLVKGQPMEVETGIMFGGSLQQRKPTIKIAD